jgi:hypothetical protein
MMGTTSLALAGIVLAVTLVGILGGSLGHWSVRHQVWTRGWVTYYVPSPEGCSLGVLGEAFGVAGLVICWTQCRRFSRLSALGVVCTFLSVMVSIAWETLVFIIS